MSFYSLSKQARAELAESINHDILQGIQSTQFTKIIAYFADEDTYIRKSAYTAFGKLYFLHKALQPKIIEILDNLLLQDDFKIRQTVINAAGEIGKKDFETVQLFFDKGLFDVHHSPRNAVIGSIKKMAGINSIPVLNWAKIYLHHPDKEVRREICHGIELRGRKYPQDILPLLKELQFDQTVRVHNTLVHVIGQIAYKKGCLQTVVNHLKTWENQQLVAKALKEIIDVHARYRDFAALTQEQAKKYIADNF